MLLPCGSAGRQLTVGEGGGIMWDEKPNRAVRNFVPCTGSRVRIPHKTVAVIVERRFWAIENGRPLSQNLGRLKRRR